MKFQTTILTLLPTLLLTMTSQASPLANSTCITPGAIPSLPSSAFRNFGVVLFRAFDMIDVFGTLDPLQLLAHTAQQMNLFFIAETLEPVTTETSSAGMNKFNSSFWPVIKPTHTFDAELDIDVLIVPGGPGVRAEGMERTHEYLRMMYPKVKIFMTICTGSGLAAKAGVLDGKMATTNKSAWKTITAMGPNVKWVSPARYVIDGKVWSSSGVTSALDLIFAFIETYWGSEPSKRIASIVEHVPREASDDPFAVHFNITPTEDKPCSVK
ncbi:Fc.00g014830.m01.CDS01 [Cosmosporella sp. VM-42]